MFYIEPNDVGVKNKLFGRILTCLPRSNKEERYIRQRYKYAANNLFNVELSLNQYGFNYECIDKLDLDKLNYIGSDRFKVYVTIKMLNQDIIPNNTSLGIVRDEKGLEILDISTGEYIHINKYNYTSIIKKSKSLTDIVRYKLEVKEVQDVSNRKSAYKVILDVTGPRVYYGFHNIYNINKKNQVDKILYKIKSELKDKGILIDFKDSHMLSLEINKTFIARGPLIEEEDILDYMFKILQNDKSNRKNSSISKNIDSKERDGITYTIKSNRIKMKIYDKTAQVFNTIGYDSGVNLYRIELTLDRSAIKNAFKTDSINTLYDIDGIEKMYLSYVEKQVIKVIKNHLEKEIKDIENLIVECNYRSLDKVYKSISKGLVDIILLGIAACNMYTKNNNKNFSRDFNKLLNTVSKKHMGRINNMTSILTEIKGEQVQLIEVPNKVGKCLKYS